MKSDLDHLPEIQQRELERVQRILMDEFSEAISRSTQPSRRNGKIYKLVLFGSFARNDWVDEPENGYCSDFDLLIVVSHADLTDIAAYWYTAEEKILRDPSIARPVNIIVHSLDEVNQALKRGEYFWVDIARDGIALYDLPGHPLAAPMPLTAADSYRMADEYFNFWIPLANHALSLSQTSVENGVLRDATFMLHQATERLYACFLLVHTLYVARSHNIKFLRSLAEDKEPRLVGAWPRETRLERARFERLKRAYVEARYAQGFAISTDDLNLLAANVAQLRDIVSLSCQERLDSLREQAGK